MAHGDYTGSTKAALARQAVEDQEFAAKRLSMVTEVTQAARQGTINLCTLEDDLLLEELKAGNLEIDGVVQGDPEALALYSPVKFRASEDQDDITVGKDRHFSIKRGQVYKAPKWVAQHLDTQDLVLH